MSFNLLVMTLVVVSGALSCDQGTETGLPETYFCADPHGVCSDVVASVIGSATSTVECAVYTFTEDVIADALVAAKQRGVQVWVVYETDQEASVAAMAMVVDKLKKAGIYIESDGNSAIMHHKFVIADGRTLASGSFNYTNSANYKNDENLMVFHSPELAARFSAEFKRLWAEGQ